MNEFLKEKTFNKKIIYFRYLCFFYILIKIDSETFVVLINTCEKPKKVKIIITIIIIIKKSISIDLLTKRQLFHGPKPNRNKISLMI